MNKNGNKELKNGGGLGGRGGGGKGSSWASEVKRGAVSFTGTDGEDNTGGGGGGTDPECRVGGAGGSGIVVVRYPSPVPLMVGGSITSKGGYQIHSFRNVGTSKLEYDPGRANKIFQWPAAGGKCFSTMPTLPWRSNKVKISQNISVHRVIESIPAAILHMPCRHALSHALYLSLPNMASLRPGLKALELRYIVVAGGGGAGGGGGGGGGVLQGVVTIKKGETWKVKVGKGGGAGQGDQI